ncbi:MAG: diaminopimelate decarboxylase [Thermoleophilia bacterium]|nr:diaminopimelate decarboxylase [Thermoleophilia bacterium]
MQPLSHVLPPSAATTPEGHLSIGGCDVVALAEEHGTPLVIYDEGLLRETMRRYVTAFRAHDSHAEVVYASKAFWAQAFLRMAHEEGLRVDVASGGELFMALRAGFPAQAVVMHGNAKDPREISEALDAGVGLIVVDSLDEIALLDRLAGERGVTQDVLIRVTPGVKPSTHAYISTGQLDSKFGFSLEGGLAAAAVAAVRAVPNLDLVGLHCHIGSQIFEIGAYRVAAALLAGFVSEVGGDLPIVDMGGGLGIAYTRHDDPPSVEEYADMVMEAVSREWEAVGLARPRVMVEPGRSMVGRAGLTVYRVTGTKDIPGVRRYAAVDGGMSDLMRPMLYGAVYEAILPERPHAEATETVRLVGKHCESGDVLIDEAELPPVRAGDLVCLPATGAYGVAMASNYNGVTRPAVVFVNDGVATTVVRRETYAELVARDL